MLRQADYISRVTSLKQSLDLAEITNDILISPIGTIGTKLIGGVARNGFKIRAEFETFHFLANNRVDRSFRYRIYEPSRHGGGKDVILIRLQSDKRFYPNNAHFLPNFPAGGAHFEEERWPEWMQDPDFIKAYRLFTMVVENGGILPEPFRSAR